MALPAWARCGREGCNRFHELHGPCHTCWEVLYLDLARFRHRNHQRCVSGLFACSLSEMATQQDGTKLLSRTKPWAFNFQSGKVLSRPTLQPSQQRFQAEDYELLSWAACFSRPGASLDVLLASGYQGSGLTVQVLGSRCAQASLC